MAGNDKFFDAQEYLDGKLESPFRNQNQTDYDDDWHSTPETFNSSDGFLTSDPNLGAPQNISEDPEEGRLSLCLFPFFASTGEFSCTNDNQSNPCERFSSRDHIDDSSWSLFPQIEPGNAILEAEKSSHKKKENKTSNFFLETEIIDSDSMPIQRDGNEAIVQDCEELKGASAIFSPTEDLSNIETTTDGVSIGSVAAAEAVYVAVPSEKQTQSRETGKAKNFECPVCRKIFGSKHYLQQHHRIHTGEKPFACDACGKRFTLRNTLKEHSLIHSGERPHACTWSGCDKKFRQKSQVKSHLRTHTKEKPFTCGQCHKEFAQSGNLRVHLRSHTDDRPYKCKWCRKGYKSKRDCMVHQQRCPDRK